MFLQNEKCEHYPCHKDIKEINCLFCFCPLYPFKKCGGKYALRKTTITNKKIKDCSECNYPHEAKNFDEIIDKVKELYIKDINGVK